MVVSDMDIGKRTNKLTENTGWFKASELEQTSYPNSFVN